MKNNYTLEEQALQFGGGATTLDNGGGEDSGTDTGGGSGSSGDGEGGRKPYLI
ncbi:hypothetical protein [Tenacibaculum sp. nBUS_03]|uniref:hypothetical protein n=1 Tax=Tenacibaculum sp. nBUS_03 TaxID=3395320 RepID=UPI003EBA555C